MFSLKKGETNLGHLGFLKGETEAGLHQGVLVILGVDLFSVNIIQIINHDIAVTQQK